MRNIFNTFFTHPGKRNEICIISARFISDFGAFLNMVALSTYVWLLSNSVISVSIFLACRVTGGIIASTVGVPFFRRFKGKSALIFFDLLRVSLLTLLLFIPTEHQHYLLPFIALGIGLGNSMFAIGLNSQLLCWIDAAKRVSVNAWLTSLAATGAVSGSLLSGLIVASYGYKAVFFVNIITYLAAALFILPLRFIHQPLANDSPPPKKEFRHLLHSLREAPLLASMLLLSMADTLGSAAHNVGFPVFAQLLNPQDAGKAMGLLLAVWAAGKFSGAKLISWLTHRYQPLRIEHAFFCGVFLMSAGFILTFQQLSLFPAIFFIIWAGVGDGIAEVSLLSRIQTEPENLRLPVFSLLTLLQMTGFGAGMLIVAPFYISLSPASVIVIFHGLPLSVLAAILFGRKYYPRKKTSSS
ncbi:MFS transporter [Enterobacteriaceae bacterium LUAb1]